jgi:hypothetical protein
VHTWLGTLFKECTRTGPARGLENMHRLKELEYGNFAVNNIRKAGTYTRPLLSST